MREDHKHQWVTTPPGRHPIDRATGKTVNFRPRKQELFVILRDAGFRISEKDKKFRSLHVSRRGVVSLHNDQNL